MNMLRGMAKFDLVARKSNGPLLTTIEMSEKIFDGLGETLPTYVSKFFGTEHHDEANYFFALASMSYPPMECDDDVLEFFLGDLPTEIEPDILQSNADEIDYEIKTCVKEGGVLVSAAPDRTWKFCRWSVLVDSNRIELKHLCDVDTAAEIANEIKYTRLENLSRDEFISSGHSLFERVRFGEQAFDNIASIDVRAFRLLCQRLANLEAHYQLGCDTAVKIVGESKSTMQMYPESRNFKSRTGEVKRYDKHFRIDRYYRVHVLIEVGGLEVGYIGPHLPIASEN